MFTKINIADNQRVIVTRNDRFVRLLTPGVHSVFAPPMLRLALESHDLSYPRLKSRWVQFLIEKRPDLVSQHFVAVQTGPLDIAMISVNGSLSEVLLPEKTALFWKDAGEVTVEVVDIGTECDAPAKMFSGPQILVFPASLDENADDWIYETQGDP